MEIIDAHAHIYPPKIASKATQTIGEFYDIKMNVNEGTSENLLIQGKNAGISKFVIHSVATKKEQVEHINDFIKEEMNKSSSFIGFMTLHQDMSFEQVDCEVSRCIKNGFKGIKLHPDFQKFYIDSQEAIKIYEAVNNRLPILFHTGDNRFDYSSPTRLAEIAKQYKKTMFIGAHFGGYRRWHEVDCYKGLNNVYFDTSSSLDFIDKQTAKSIIDKLGVEKFFFGTDFPMWDATKEVQRVLSLNLTDSENEMIFSQNFSSFIKM